MKKRITRKELLDALKETYPKDKAMRDTLELQYFKALSVIEWIELRIGLHKLSKEEWDEKYKEKDWCGVESNQGTSLGLTCTCKNCELIATQLIKKNEKYGDYK